MVTQRVRLNLQQESSREESSMVNQIVEAEDKSRCLLGLVKWMEKVEVPVRPAGWSHQRRRKRAVLIEEVEPKKAPILHERADTQHLCCRSA